MAKVARSKEFVVFLLVMVVMISTASALRASITIEELGRSPKESQSQSERCMKQIQEHELSNCRRVIRPSRTLLALPGIEDQQKDQIPLCCKELGKFESRCQCEALKYIVARGSGAESTDYSSTAAYLSDASSSKFSS
ncbi:hypothetical protein K2173_009258 [Erythroxylum novogranatense]|uniref:Bifunctional inhibitor/plant lipid transfer protein/seed storage helical domain-containing protein n=1 Tax=Erythroxylum novogranatense TaxID=1862640 RepID=A0AAV8S5P8_9ROSI|nr:hypothetical protein K2173_009258 [Erythroxylum novogranatense]